MHEKMTRTCGAQMDHEKPESSCTLVTLSIGRGCRRRSATISKTTSVSLARQLIPTEVVSELMNVVFKVKRFFDSSFILVALATTLFLVLVLLLSLRLRRAERNTMFRIGCARGTIFWLHFLELGVILLAAGGAATLLSFLTLSHAPRLLQWLS